MDRFRLKRHLPWLALALATQLAETREARAQSANASRPQPRSHVVLLLSPEVDALTRTPSFATLLGVELDAVVERAASPLEDGRMVVSLTGHGDETVVTLLLGNRRTTRTVDLAQVPPSDRPRTLALAIAELARVSKNASTPPPPRLVAPAIGKIFAPPATLPTDASPPAALRSVHLTAPLLVGASLGLRVYPTFGAALLGPRIAASLALDPRRHIRVHIDGGFMVGRANDPLGDVALRIPYAGAEVSYAIELESLHLGLSAGPRFELGGVTAEGAAASPLVRGSVAHGLVPTLLLAMGARLRLAPRVLATLGAEIGTVLSGLDLRADGRRATGIGGVVLGVQLGVATDLF